MSTMNLAFPYGFDSTGRTAQSPSVAQHVADMIELILFTSPGERVNRPTFGSGTAQLVFAPNSDVLAAAQTDSGQHFMPPSRETRQHAACVGGVRRLGQNFPVDHHGGIGAQYRLAVRRLNGVRLGLRQPLHVIGGALCGPHGFVHIGRAHREWNPGLAQNFAAAGRLRGKYEHLPSVK